MTVAVIVPARDAHGTLGAALAAIAGQDPEHETIVVDDGSHPAIDAPGVRVVRTDGVGPGAARNAGAAATEATVLAFTDADCVPGPGWLAAGLRALESADLVQGRVVPDPTAPRHPFDRTIAVPGPSPLFETANLFVRRELFERLGGFPDGIADPRKHLAEDVFFGWAARRAGARIAFAPDALVQHAVFTRTARAFIAERARLRHFPAMVAAVPELRRSALCHGVFLTARSRDFDAALVAVLAAGLLRRPGPLIAAAPYALRVLREGRRWPDHPALPTSAATVVADAVSAAALLSGSVRSATPVL